MCSGRIPMITSRPAPACSTLARIPFGSLTSPNGVRSWPSSMAPGRKFIDGEPMKPATNRLRGCSYSSCGVPTCWITPVRMTATRSPSVIASVWSWVT